MKKQTNPQPTEEFVVRYWYKPPDQEFSSQREMTFKYFSKNRHEQAKKDFTGVMRKLGGEYSIISINYQ